MLVFDVITREIPDAGLTLLSPVKRIPFIVRKGPGRTTFLCGTKTAIPIPAAIWNGIPQFLREQDWVKIGMGYNQAEERTLQWYIDNHPSRGTQHSSDANYVASVLEHLGIAYVSHDRPSRIKLK